MVRKCGFDDFEEMFAIINDAAQSYKGIIPGDCWKEPYMEREELWNEISLGVKFWGFEFEGGLVGIMGMQAVKDVVLIRHAYVRSKNRNQGVGSQLLSFLRKKTRRPILVGTWRDASWAVSFYEKHGFKLCSDKDSESLLKKYWSIPQRQARASVVLTEGKCP